MPNFQKQSKKYDYSYTLSFEGWIKEKLDNGLKNSFKKDNLKFDELVNLLDQYNLEFKERKNGFCISSKSENYFAKQVVLIEIYQNNSSKKDLGK